MKVPAYQYNNDQHRMIVTSEDRTTKNVRRICDEMGYEVVAVMRSGEAVKLVDGWAFVFTIEEASIATGSY